MSWDTLVDLFVSLWNFRLIAVDGKAITLGKLALGVFLLFVAHYLANRIAKTFEKRILDRLEIEQSLKASLSKISFYFLFVLMTVFVLHLINVPVTVFTVFGGALAIGVGFGSQNIVNNFISGLIIMIERPVNVGDLVEVDTLRGVVEEIGARSTKIKALDNTHYVVPNSAFLEKNVLNWTLSDDIVRSKVSVGIAYGADTHLAEKLLVDIAKKQGEVLSQPEPLVIFSAFGDNSLNFDLYYWSRMRSFMQLQRLASRIRFEIDDAFRQHNVVIAFPQRDIHIDTSSPIDVRLHQGPPN
ncbi:MAG: mechanosensitive ion channel protein [Bdellovibrionaceae bacterium]|nr:mechanosensitive ion channel protein [Pseudobdellovibrionaceae bacterium]